MHPISDKTIECIQVTVKSLRLEISVIIRFLIENYICLESILKRSIFIQCTIIITFALQILNYFLLGFCVFRSGYNTKHRIKTWMDKHRLIKVLGFPHAKFCNNKYHINHRLPAHTPYCPWSEYIDIIPTAELQDIIISHAATYAKTMP